MCQITPFIRLTPFRPEIRKLHFFSLLRRLTTCFREPAQCIGKARSIFSAHDHSRSYTTPILPAPVESTCFSPWAASVCTPDAGCTLMAVGTFAPFAKKAEAQFAV